MPPFQPKPQPVYSEEERITYEEVPAGTLMRVVRVVDIVDGVETVRFENKDILWGKTKADIVAEVDAERSAKTAEVAKLDAIKSELNK